MEENKNIGGIFWIIVVFMILVVGIISFYYNDLFLANRVKDSENISNVKNYTTEQVKLALENQASFVGKNLENSSTASMSDLNRDLSIFVLVDSEGVNLKKEIYTDGSNGWSITYGVNKKMYDVYYELLKISKTAPYSVSFGSRADLASIIISESDKYYIKIISEQIKDDKSRVSINVIEN